METERFNFWCKGCGGVVWGFKKDHQHTAKQVQNKRRNAARKARNQAMRDCGLVSYRTSSGAVRWE